MTEKEIKTQDVYLQTEKLIGGNDNVLVLPMRPNPIKLEKRTDMIVLTKEELIKIIGDAFDAGAQNNENRNNRVSHTVRTDKEQYISTTLK